MATVAQPVQSTSAAAFSNGKDQALNNTAILNAGGNIIYLEWNPPPNDNSSVPGPSHTTDSIADVDALQSVCSTMSEILSSSQRGSEPLTQIPSPFSSRSPTSSQPLRITADSVDLHDNNDNNEQLTPGHVSMTPSHVPGFHPTEALLRAPSSCEVYVEEMFPLKHGYPLWLPQLDRNLPIEYRCKGVSIGDVGLITPDGGFDFLFNIWSSSHIFPDHPIQIPLAQTSTQALFHPRSMISSISDIEPEVDWNTMDISYSVEIEGRGAILSMPYGASQEDYKNERLLKGFIAKNAEDWYRYALVDCGRDLDRHSLYLVTGCLKSRSWGIATYNKPLSNPHTTLVIGKSPDTAGPAYEWKRSGKASAFRTGPLPDDTTDTENRLPNTENQCLFLRGFKISLSEQAWRNLNLQDVILREDVNETEDVGLRFIIPGSKMRRINKDDGTLGDTSNLDQRNTVSISNFPAKQKPFHPLNVINDMLLSQVSEARIAITHDKQWWGVDCDNEYKGKKHCDLDHARKRIRHQYFIGYHEGTKACTLEPRDEVKVKLKGVYETDISLRDALAYAKQKEVDIKKKNNAGRLLTILERSRQEPERPPSGGEIPSTQQLGGPSVWGLGSSPRLISRGWPSSRVDSFRSPEPGLSFSSNNTPSSSFSPPSTPSTSLNGRPADTDWFRERIMPPEPTLLGYPIQPFSYNEEFKNLRQSLSSEIPSYPSVVLDVPVGSLHSTMQPRQQALFAAYHRRLGRTPKETNDILKSWIRQHPEHPYPTEEETRSLCSATGLDMGQVSNRMISLRRRIMVPSSSHRASISGSSSSTLELFSSSSIPPDERNVRGSGPS